MDAKQVDVMVADASHEVYVDKILDTIREAAKVRGTGIAERTHEYVTTKMKEGKAIIALCGDDFAGFTYIESWGNKQYVATSGLIVHPNYRGIGLAKRIKAASFRLARLRWPKAKIFSLTSGAAVMKMNTELGYVPVTFNELTDDEEFKQKVSKLVRWHMQPLFYDKNLPFFQPQDMINDVEYKEVALLSLCDRLGRGNLDEDRIKEEKERIESFKAYFEK